ncbi:MAG: cell division protein FtsQ/DivIB [Lachnospiraceae bacterium]|nr:cell division protein FtsQ/DivIB [Lachnospiraceae bacterium]
MADTVRSKKGRKGLIIATAVLAIIAVLLLSVLGIFRVREVTVSGNEYYTNEEIANLVIGDGISRNTLYLYFRYKYMEQPEIPFIDTFDIEIDSFSSITIRVYEKEIVGYVKYLGKNVYFDKDGIVVESSDEVMEGVPLISGISFDELAMYEALNVPDPDIFNTILNLTQLLSKYDLVPDEIRFGSSSELYLELGDVTVELGEGDYLDEKISRLKQLESDLEGCSGTLHMENYTDESTHISLEAAK